MSRGYYIKPMVIKIGAPIALSSSPELKASVCFSDHLSPCVSPSVCKLFKFNYEIAKMKLFSRTTGRISTKLGTNHLWVVKSTLFK